MTRSRLVQRKEMKKPIKRKKKKIPMKRNERSKLVKRRNRSSERTTRTLHQFVLGAAFMGGVPRPRWCFITVVRDLTARGTHDTSCSCWQAAHCVD